MARTFEEVLRDGINNALFIEKMEDLAPRRKPVRTMVQPTGTLFAIRNKRVTIREGALRHVQVIITYIKETTGETKKYIVAPYSYRYRRLKTGRKKMLFAWDMDDNHIKGFVLNNIRNVALTDRKFMPKYRVEL
jgi:predicted DNA-binding transcriptional regulator YafY